MTRRTLMLAAVAALRLRADSASEVWDVIDSVAAALAAGEADDALSHFDRGMPGYEQLRSYVTGMLRSRAVECAIAPASNEGDDRERKLDLDWTLNITDPNSESAYVRRERRVTCRLAKQGRRWRIVAFDPVALFAPL